MSDSRPPTLPVGGATELVLEVADLERAEEFYAGLLGFPVVARWPGSRAGRAAGTFTSPYT